VEDASALVAKMERAYSSLKSYSQTATATGEVVIENFKRRGVVNSQILYVAPNKLRITLTNDAVGTVVVTSDGKELVVSGGKRKAPAHYPAPATLREIMAKLKAHQIVATLDPLYFLTGETASKMAGGFTIKGEDTIVGELCDKVAGVIKREGFPNVRGGTITFWIDRKTSLLRKTELMLKGVPLRTASSTDPGTTPIVATNLSDQSLTEVVSKLAIDPSLKPGDFQAPAASKPKTPIRRRLP
jgi:outer membrane lipoprotein-sorting protein